MEENKQKLYILSSDNLKINEATQFRLFKYFTFTLLSLRCSEDLKLPGDEAAGKNRACYNVEFTFDADTQVAITIYYQAIEEFHNGVPV